MPNYFDLSNSLLADTILCVKYTSASGAPVWVHYNIPLNRSNGSERSFGDLYTYFSNKEGFRFAKGLIRLEEGEFWKGISQYFYFSKEEPPHMDVRQFKSPIYISKKL